jgi:hypothetical protein
VTAGPETSFTLGASPPGTAPVARAARQTCTAQTFLGEKVIGREPEAFHIWEPSRWIMRGTSRALPVRGLRGSDPVNRAPMPA